jgi:hypothetical protein
VLSTDSARTYKPDPNAYALGVTALKMPREHIFGARRTSMPFVVHDQGARCSAQVNILQIPDPKRIHPWP